MVRAVLTLNFVTTVRKVEIEPAVLCYPSPTTSVPLAVTKWLKILSTANKVYSLLKINLRGMYSR